MTGVDILSTYEKAVDFVFNWTGFWITFGVIVFIGLIFGIVCMVREDCEWYHVPIFMGIFAVIGCMFAALIGTGMEKPVAYETRYKVTISEEVSMVDFLEKYEIVDTEGKIYTVREVKGEN